MNALIVVAVLVVLLILFSVTCIKIVPQATAAVVERFGSYLATWNNGLHMTLKKSRRYLRIVVSGIIVNLRAEKRRW